VRNTPVANVAEPQNPMRDSENAASTAITIERQTTQTETITEFLKKIRNCSELRSAQ
jgi:hypothetical protein